MAEAVRNQPSLFTRLTDGAKQTYNDVGQKASKFASDVANNDKFTSTITSLDPFRGGISKEWYQSSQPKWLKPTVVGTATASLGTSVYLICKNKWLEKPLCLRRITGALLVLPAVYFAGYGVYTLFRKGTEWNNNRLAAKEQKLIAADQTKIQANYDTKFEEIFKKSADDQYAAIAKLAKDENLGLDWITESGKNYVELKFNIRGQTWSFKKPIADELHQLQTTKAEEAKQAEINKKIVGAFTASANDLLDQAKTKPEVREIINKIYFQTMEPNGFEKGDFGFSSNENKYYLSISYGGTEIHKQEISQEARDHLEGIQKNWVLPNNGTGNIADSVLK